MIIQDLGKSIEEYRTKLVIVDSIIALHRAEFTGRGTLAERQQRLNMMLHKLSRFAEVHNIAVVVTNQVQSQPDDFSAGRDGLRATGGNVMGHATTHRIFKLRYRRLASRSISSSGIFSYEPDVFGLSPNRLLIIESSNANAGRLVLDRKSTRLN